MDRDLCFVTVCGGGEDYDFLLGSIEHHAEMGQHLVLDTTPVDRARRFKLPKSVIWRHHPDYGAGWKEFKLRTALEDALKMAKSETDASILAVLDCDEFYAPECAEWAFKLGRDRMVEFKTVTWRSDGKAYDLGESEWHRRVWPAAMDVKILKNESWIAHPQYNGNPEHHPIASPPDLDQIVRAHGSLHNHVHYAIGAKASETETADTTIDGWKMGGFEASRVPWPVRLRVWQESGERPSGSPVFSQLQVPFPALPGRA